MAVQDILKQLNKSIEGLKDALPKVPKKKKTLAKRVVQHKKEEKPTRIEIRLMDVIKITITILAVYYLSNLVTEIKSVLVVLFLSIIIASALTPGVDWLEKKKIPRVLGAIIIYILVLGVIALILSSFIPVIAEQMLALAVNLSNLFQQLVQMDLSTIPLLGRFAPDFSDFLAQLSGDQLVAQIENGLKALAGSLYAIGNSGYFAIKTVFGGIFNAFMVFILSFYMVLEKKSLERSMTTLIPDRHVDKFIRLNNNLQTKMGAWLRGQLTVSFILGVLTWIGLKIIGIPYAATLALFTGIITIIPYLGVWLALIPPLAIGFTVSLWAAVFVAITYAIVQFLEGNFISPLVMSRAVDLNPVTVIIVLLIGGELFGILGVALAIPVTAAVTVFIDDYQEHKK
ncbi:MAG: AI-2E family transporter [Candidatus Gracilibacteria bacterium]|nr:AI-2E family transporter [Candidatus Gracilibacteria bacterium]